MSTGESGPRDEVFPSIPALFQARTAERAAEAMILRNEAGVWRAVTGREAAGDVRRMALGLAVRGVKKGDRVAILASTRPEWACADMAVLHLGAVTVGIYPTLLAADVGYQLADAGVRACIAEDGAQLEKVRAVLRDVPSLERVVVIDRGSERLRERELTLDELLARGEGLEGNAAALAAFDGSWRGVQPDDLATIIYTSGTTGPPKGALLTHGNMLYTVRATVSLFPSEGQEIGVVFLPLAHALQRFGIYGGLYRGARGAYARSVETFMEDVKAIRPTVQVSVPRLWEKAYAKIREGVARAGPRRRRLFEWALSVGRRSAPYRKEGRPMPLGLRIAFAVANRLVYRRVKRAMFGDRIKFLTSGGAPIELEVLEFFYALDLLIIEAYGLTETAAPATINRRDRFKLGTVGLPIPGTEVRIAPDGEVLVRGPGVFSGYWRNDEATRAAFEDNWFKTGDIGEVDADGFLKITDRKKDLIVTSLGKKVPPQNVENAIKARCPLAGPVLVHGDRRKFISGLVSLDPEETLAFARACGIAPPAEPGADARAEAARALPELSRHPDVRAAVERALGEVNATLAPHERVKRWEIVPDVWSVEDGSLTPTLKLKRRVLEKRYASVLDGFYREDVPAGAGGAAGSGPGG